MQPQYPAPSQTVSHGLTWQTTLVFRRPISSSISDRHASHKLIRSLHGHPTLRSADNSTETATSAVAVGELAVRHYYDIRVRQSLTLSWLAKSGVDDAMMTSNETLNATTLPCDENDFVINDVIGIWITGCICLLGLTGNCISFVVLQRAFGSSSPMFYVLRAMSLSDAVFLLSVFTVQTVVNLHSWTGILQVLYQYRGFIQYSVWPVLMTTQVRHC